MALLAGTVTVADNGTVTSTAASMAKAIYDEFEANYQADYGVAIPAGAAGARVKRNFAGLATRIAKGVVDHVVAHAAVSTTVSAGGLQRDPDGASPATLAPAAPVILAGTVG